MVAATADAGGNFVVPISALRMKVNSYSAGAILKLDMLHTS